MLPAFRSSLDPRQLLTVAVILSLATSARSAPSSDYADAFDRVRPSLVLVSALVRHGQRLADKYSGTGFVVASDAHNSFVLTSAHVIEGCDAISVSAYRIRHTFDAKVVLRDKGLDIAILEIATGDLESVRFQPATREMRVGNSVAVAGFLGDLEASELWGGQELYADSGAVVLISPDGTYAEVRIPVGEGLSGAPAFDIESGEVVGMIQRRREDGQAGYIVSASRVLVPMLISKELHVATADSATVPERSPTTTPVPQRAPIPDSAGANHFVVIAPDDGKTDLDRAIASGASEDLANKIRAAFQVTVTLVPGHARSRQEAAQIARDNDAILAVVPRYSGDSRAFRVTESVILTDRFGDDPAHTSNEAIGQGGKGREILAVLAVLADLSNKAVLQLQTHLRGPSADQSSITNLIRYGLALPTGAKVAFFGLKVDAGHVLVSYAAPFGSAAEAGLRQGDEVLSVNGQATSKMTDGDIRDFFGPSEPESFDLEIRGGDGQTKHVGFSLHDLPYYVSRREAMAAGK